MQHRPVVLIILDGWGHNDNPKHNAIASANTPTWDELWQQRPHCLLSASGPDVGLPNGQMGNSEVGHMTMGAGRAIYQDLSRIDMAIKNNTFATNPVLNQAINKAISNNKAIHIVGLLSPGGVHSHARHIHALLELAAQHDAQRVYLHAFLDGRDTPPQSAKKFIEQLEQHCKKIGVGQLASICGRYYAMDRDQRWDRTQQAYELLTDGSSQYHFATGAQALACAYQRHETDEFVAPTSIHDANTAPSKIKDGDCVLLMNFRSDRMRQLARAFAVADFSEFKRTRQPHLSSLVSLTRYADDIPTKIAFPAQPITNHLGEYLAAHGLTQLRLAETEKYAHVTFFFNGGTEMPYSGEDRILIPSPKVATYDTVPQMSAKEITSTLVAAILQQKYDMIIVNFANADMVGHTGNFAATISAVECLDQCLQKIITALSTVGGQAVITADHGNAERMFNEKTQQAHTAHTSDPIPFVYVGQAAHIKKQQGTLADLAPTLLHLLNLIPPSEMTGTSLLATKFHEK